MTRRFVLASASPARRRLLEQAGFNVEVIVSGVDEDQIDTSSTRIAVAELAELKAQAVVAGLSADALVVACDSLFDLEGRSIGKPASRDEAAAVCRSQRGKTGILMTGQCLIDTMTGRQAIGVAETRVHFGHMSDAEIDAYVASGEPLSVAGSFTLDGLSSPFIEGITGDPSNVIGLSLPLLRRQLGALDIAITELWR